MAIYSIIWGILKPVNPACGVQRARISFPKEKYIDSFFPIRYTFFIDSKGAAEIFCCAFFHKNF